MSPPRCSPFLCMVRSIESECIPDIAESCHQPAIPNLLYTSSTDLITSCLSFLSGYDKLSTHIKFLCKPIQFTCQVIVAVNRSAKAQIVIFLHSLCLLNPNRLCSKDRKRRSHFLRPFLRPSQSFLWGKQTDPDRLGFSPGVWCSRRKWGEGVTGPPAILDTLPFFSTVSLLRIHWEIIDY